MNSLQEPSEHVEAPPETSGIAQQPTQDELSAIASSYDSPGGSTKPTAAQLVIFGVVVVALGLIASVWFMSATRQNEPPVTQAEIPEVISEPEATTSAEIDEFSLLDHVFAGTFTEEFAGKMTSQPFDTQWKDRGLDFTMQHVYDLGVVSSRDYALSTEYLGKRVVVVELQVVDTRLTGEPVEVNAYKYVATRFEQTDTPASDWREVLLNPGEEKTVFVPFILDRNSLNYFILSGDLRNPFVSPMGEPEAPQLETE